MAGRRWRKTTMAMHPAIECALRGDLIFWGAPTYDQARIGWDEIDHACGDMAEFRLTRMQIDFPSGGRITFRSLDDPKNARGHTAHGLVLEEAGYIPSSAYYDVLRPMMSDTQGWELLIGTPFGRNWFWREWMAAKDYEDSQAWQIPTLGVAIRDGALVREPHPLENPHFAFAEAVRMFETMPERTFRQEFLAEPMDDAGLVFRNVGAVSTGERQGPIEGHSYVFGVDWAKAHDWTVISVFDATTVQQVSLDRFNKIDYHFQLGRLEARVEEYKPDSIVAEANAMGEPLVEQLRRKGLPVRGFTTTSASKTKVIEALALAIERGKIRLLDDETQKAELMAFDMRRLPGGSFRYEAPSGMHDDTVIATALAWHGIGRTHAGSPFAGW